MPVCGQVPGAGGWGVAAQKEGSVALQAPGNLQGSKVGEVALADEGIAEVDGCGQPPEVLLQVESRLLDEDALCVEHEAAKDGVAAQGEEGCLCFDARTLAGRLLTLEDIGLGVDHVPPDWFKDGPPFLWG
jgi:hypothetical protein